MVSAFDAFDEQAAAATVLAFGEDAILTRRISSQYVEPTVDAEQAAVTVRGVFSAHAANSDLRGQGRGSEISGTTRITSEQSEFWIAKEQADGLGSRPARGDQLSLPGRPGAPTFAISAIHPTNMGDLNLLLVREDVPT